MHQISRKGLIAIVMVLVVSAWFPSAELVAQQSSPRVRTLGRSFDVPIADQLKVDDEVVVFREEINKAVLSPDPSAQEVIEDASKAAELVAVVDIRRVEPTLVLQGTWIHTRLTVTVRELIKPSTTRSLSRGSVLAMEVSGGELRIGKVLVKALPILPFKSGEQYLVFLVPNARLEALDTTHPPLLVQNGRVSSILPGGEDTDKLHGMKIDDIRRQISRVSKK